MCTTARDLFGQKMVHQNLSQVQVPQFRTSADWHLSRPRAIALAHSVFRTPRQEVAVLTAVHQGVAVSQQIHPRHVHVERALRLLTGVRWCEERGVYCLTRR